MLALISPTVSTDNDHVERKEQTSLRAILNHRYHGFVNWMFEPISFPGKWPEPPRRVAQIK
jgi:hypothetical protein